MPYYKDVNSKLYHLDSADFEYLLPSGCIEITNSEAAQIQAAQIPPWSSATILKEVRSARDDCLNKLMGICLAAQIGNDTATVTACLATRIALLNITIAPGVQAATNDNSLRVALTTAYAAIVAAAPTNIVNAFAEFNL